MKRQLILAGAGACALFAAGCVGLPLQDRERTQIVTFPTNADIELNGKRLGEAPVLIQIPHDTNGVVTERTIVRAIPKTTNQFVQVREFTSSRTNPLPLRVMIDMRWPDTNATSVAFADPGTPAVETNNPSSSLLSPRARANQN